MEFKNNIIHRPELTNDYDGELSLGHLMIKNFTNAGDKTLLVCGVTGRKMSAIEIANRSIEVSKALLAAGVSRGDVISIVSENRLEFVFVLLGSIFLNCKFAPINNTYSQRELEHALKISKPKIVFASSSVKEKIANAAQSLVSVKKIVLFDDVINADKVVISFKDFMNSRGLKEVEFKPQPVDKNSTVCFIMCSSGTTGLPKGVQLSQANMIAAIRFGEVNLFTRKNVGTDDIVVLGLLPLFHVAGVGLLTCALASTKASTVLLPRFEEKSFLGTIQRYRCNVAFLVPPLMVFLAKNPIVDQFDLSSLRFIMYGAAPMSKDIEQLVRDRLRVENLWIIQSYGMTEMTLSVLLNKDIIKPGSTGDVNAGVYVKVIDKTGNALGPHQKGELCFKGNVIMMNYIDDEKATRETIDAEGWLHTGDVGYYDEDYQFFIVDRIKELIKYKGNQVPPAEIEALLLTHVGIRDCGVVGKLDELAGELPLAFVVKADAKLTTSDVINFVRDRASPAKRLHGGVIFVDEIPKNPSGKILRRKLRELLKVHELKAKI